MKNKDNSFHYFVSQGYFCISDLDFCGNSERTIDINLYDIANNSDLLNLLHLFYMQGNYGATYTYTSRAEWFCGYLVAFKRGDQAKTFYNKALTNPIVRLLVEDENLFEKVKQTV